MLSGIELGLRELVQRAITKGHLRKLECPNENKHEITNAEQDGIRKQMYVSKQRGLQKKK